jgi:hypothetical protein
VAEEAGINKFLSLREAARQPEAIWELFIETAQFQEREGLKTKSIWLATSK